MHSTVDVGPEEAVGGAAAQRIAGTARGPFLSIVPARAVSDVRLTDADFRVLSAIGIHTNPNGEGARASGRILAKEATLTRTQFFRSAKRLLDLGYVRRKSRLGQPSIYAINLDRRAIAVRHGRWTPVPKNGTGSPEPKSGTRPVPRSGTQTVPTGQFNGGVRPLVPSRPRSSCDYRRRCSGFLNRFVMER